MHRTHVNILLLLLNSFFLSFGKVKSTLKYPSSCWGGSGEMINPGRIYKGVHHHPCLLLLCSQNRKCAVGLSRGWARRPSGGTVQVLRQPSLTYTSGCLTYHQLTHNSQVRWWYMQKWDLSDRANQPHPDGVSLARGGVSLSIKKEVNRQWGNDRQCLECSWISKRQHFYKGSEARHSSAPKGLSCDFIQFNKYLLCIFCQLKCKNSKVYLYPPGIKQYWNRQWALNKCRGKEGKKKQRKKKRRNLSRAGIC